MGTVNTPNNTVRLRWDEGDIIPLWVDNDPSKGYDIQGYLPPLGEWLRFELFENSEKKTGMLGSITCIMPDTGFTRTGDYLFITGTHNTALVSYRIEEVKNWTKASQDEVNAMF